MLLLGGLFEGDHAHALVMDTPGLVWEFVQRQGHWRVPITSWGLGNATAVLPVPRWSHTALALQDGSARVIMHGGCARGAPFNVSAAGMRCDILQDFWYHQPSRDGYAAAWKPLHVTEADAPHGIPLLRRAGHSLTVQTGVTGEQHLFLFGGYNSVSGVDDQPQWIAHQDIVNVPFMRVDLQTKVAEMVQSASGERPLPRFGHVAVSMWSAIHDNQVMLVAGGATVDTQQNLVLLDDVWMFNYDQMTWVRLLIANGPSPSPRFGHSAVAYGTKILVYGGKDNTIDERTCSTAEAKCSLQDLWELDFSFLPATWTLLSASGFADNPSLHFHSAVMMGREMFGELSPASARHSWYP